MNRQASSTPLAFEEPRLEIVLIRREDIVTTSPVGPPTPDDNWGQWDPRPNTID